MKDKLIELIKSHRDPCDIGACPFTVDDVRPCSLCETESLAEHLIANGVTIQPVLTVAEKADLDRICKDMLWKCTEMCQPGMWARYTQHMECGEIRAFAQMYKDMELKYKVLTGHEMFAPQLKDGAT